MLNFYSNYKNVSCYPLKHFWLSANVKPTPNQLCACNALEVHACTLSVYYYLYGATGKSYVLFNFLNSELEHWFNMDAWNVYTHRESLGEIKYRHDSTTKPICQIFTELIKKLFAIHLKHSSFWPSADVKPMSNQPCACNALAVHECTLSVYTTISMQPLA